VLEVGVAAGAVDDGLKASEERHGAICCVEREVWDVGFSAYGDPVQLAVEVANRLQGAGDALDRIHVSVFEEVFTIDFGIAGSVSVPRAECAGCVNLAFGDRIGKKRIERPGVVRSEIAQNDVLEQEDARVLVGLVGTHH
jgi:hypothetical protein